MAESVTAGRYPPSPCPTAQSQSSCASSTITCPNLQVRSAAAPLGHGLVVRGLTAGGQFPDVQQIGDAEHLAAEITGADGDVSTPWAQATRRARSRTERTRAARSSCPRSSAASSRRGTSAAVQPPGSRRSAARSAAGKAGAALASRAGSAMKWLNGEPSREQIWTQWSSGWTHARGCPSPGSR
jgi:hypothetical protein